MEFLNGLQVLSSTGLIDFIFETLGTAGDWAGAAADLIGLL